MSDLLFLFCILLLVSIPILIVSMLLTSQLMGGVDFGPLPSVLGKSALILVAVNAIGLVPGIGPWVALVVWFLGLMSLFRLDARTTMTPVFINWGLNFLFRLFLLNALLHMLNAS